MGHNNTPSNNRSARTRNFIAVAALCAVAVVTTSCLRVNNMYGTGDAQPGERVVALTFDDGPHPIYTPQILDILARHNVKATFFVTGSQASRYPHILDRMVREGHRVANHTWNHPRLTSISNGQIAAEIGWFQAWLANRGIQSRCVRPPYGATDARVDAQIRQHANNSFTMMWDIDTNDWRRPGTAAIVNNVTRNLRPGAVILMHDGGGNRDQTVAAVDQMIPRIRQAGYQLRPVC